ncbi:large subunit of alpha-aminoadipate reductase [Colletotrichum tropicale]|nr:large subunit of alpha-aminoadipate reductase [Colletotrichum tropicale]
MLVSYIVPEIAEWKRWLEAQNRNDVEDEDAEMGSRVVYLKRIRRIQAEAQLPLNLNGEVNSRALPFPDATERMEDASEEDQKSWKAL